MEAFFVHTVIVQTFFYVQIKFAFYFFLQKYNNGCKNEKL